MCQRTRKCIGPSARKGPGLRMTRKRTHWLMLHMRVRDFVELLSGRDGDGKPILLRR